MWCPVHFRSGCSCRWARSTGTLIVALSLSGCAALASVTPTDRAKAYQVEAAAAQAECKAYRFDRAAGLVSDVPAMTELCE